MLAVGAMNRRKGPERFVDLMALLARRADAPVGVWLGGDAGSVVWSEIADDVRRSGVHESIRLIPAVVDPLSYLAAADVVVSTAIEDPYPLAVLEAAALGVPVVGFDSGGLAQVFAGPALPRRCAAWATCSACGTASLRCSTTTPARRAAGDSPGRVGRAHAPDRAPGARALGG